MTPQEFLASGGYIDAGQAAQVEIRPPMFCRIISAVARISDVTEEDILGRRRNIRVALPRHVAMRLAQEMMPYASLPTLGRLFRRDHTTILYVVSGEAKTVHLEEFELLYNAARDALDAS